MQSESRKLIDQLLDDFGLEPRALGRSDYPTESPLGEVLVVARHCAGGVILGYCQDNIASGTRKYGTDRATPMQGVPLPSPWNQLEAGILFALRLPLVVFCDDGISGSIFDRGVGDFFIHRMPLAARWQDVSTSVREVLLKWQSRVRERYYAY